MTLSKIRFNRNSSGLSKPLPGKDHYSSMIFYNNTLPSGFLTTDRIKQVFSPSDAEALGIVATYPDETQATANYLVTGVGADGDTLELKVLVPNLNNVSIGVYTKITADSTATNIAVAYRAIVNAGTITHGYIASGAGANVLITAPKGTGVKLNSGTPLAAVVVGTIAGTITQFSGGVGSLLAAYHYHIKEYFRIQPGGVLWVGIFAVPGSYDFSEIATMQTFALGDIREIGIYVTGTPFATSQMGSMQTQATSLENLNTPLSIIYSPEISGTAALSSLPDLSTLTYKNVSATICQDGAALGYDLFLQLGKSIGAMGATLGTVALSTVSQCIAYVDLFNVGAGSELDTLAFANGLAYKGISAAQLETLDNKNYIFLLKQIGISGSYFNYDYTAIAQSNDFSTISKNRTIDKAVRNVRSITLPRLNGPIVVKSDGTLSEDFINDLKTLMKRPLDQMESDGDLSASAVIINPAQNVGTTSTFTATLELLPIGVSKFINLNIGFTVKI